MTTEHLPDLADECFLIAPIGDEGSDVRDRSDGVMEYIVAPAAKEHELETVRADKIAKPGQITRQVIEHVVGAKAAVVDLTGANPNVYYEMAVRHTAQLPTVLIAQEGEKLPFDIAQMRTIFFDHTSLKSAADCRSEISKHLGEALRGEVDSPIAVSVAVQHLESGTAQERILAQLVENTDEIRVRLRHLERSRPREDARYEDAIEYLTRGVTTMRNRLAQGHFEEGEVLRVLNDLEGPLEYLMRNTNREGPRPRALRRRAVEDMPVDRPPTTPTDEHDDDSKGDDESSDQKE
jgi:hypothetical protein